MIAAVVTAISIAALILALAFVMPCEACRKRKQRLEDAYQSWRAQNPSRSKNS
jgi:hypothetical protein